MTSTVTAPVLIDATPISAATLAGDDPRGTLLPLLRSMFGEDIDDLRFRLMRLPLENLRAGISDPEGYLMDEDLSEAEAQEHYEYALDMADRYRAGDDPKPIVVRLNDQQTLRDVYDGYHRLAGAGQARPATVDAYVLDEATVPADIS